MQYKLETPVRDMYFNNLILAIRAYLIELWLARGTGLRIKLSIKKKGGENVK